MSGHAILRARFELDVDSVAVARSVQERVSAFARGPLPGLLDDGLSGIGGQHVLERLELDLGQLEETALEAQLADGVRRALAAALAKLGLAQRQSAPAQGPPGATVAASTAAGHALAAMRAWLLGAEDTQPAALFRQALRDAPSALLELIRELGRRHAVRQRLVRRLAGPALEQLVRELEPAEAQLMIDYVDEAGLLHRQRPLVSDGEQGFRHALWEFVLGYLLLERGSYFNARAMVGHTLLQMAGRYGIAYHDLLLHMSHCLETLATPKQDRSGLGAMLRDLHGAAAPAGGTVSLRHRGDRLGTLLEHGVWSGAGDRATLLEEFDALWRDSPETLAALLRQRCASSGARKRLARALPDARLEQLAELLAPRQGAWIAAVVATLRRIQARELLLPEREPVFGRRLWEFALQALLGGRGDGLTPRALAQSLLRQLAAHYGVGYRVLLQAVGGADMAAPPAAGADDAAQAAEPRRQREGTAVAAVLAELEAELPAIAPSLQPQPARFARAVREFAVLSFQLDRGSHFNNRSYIKNVLRQLCARHGLAYADLLRGLSGQSRDDGARSPTGLATILAELRKEAAPLPLASEPRPPAADASDPLRAFLLRGDLPARPGALLRGGLRALPAAALAAALDDGARRAGVIERLVRYLPPEQLARLPAMLAPELAGFVETCVLALLHDARTGGEERGVHVWRAVLRALTRQRGGPRSASRFLDDVLYGLASALGLTPAALRARLRRAAAGLAGARPRFQVLADVLDDAAQAGMDHQAGATSTPAPASASSSAATTAPEAGWLASLLQYGMAAALTQAQAPDRAVLLARVGKALDEHPAAMRAVLLRAGRRELERQRYAFLLPAALRARMLALLTDSGAAAQWAWWQALLTRACAAAGSAGGGAYWERILSAELLRALAAGGGRAMAPSRYMRGLALRLAQRHGIAPDRLLAAVRRETEQAGAPTAARAASLLALLERAAQAPPPRRAAPPPAAEPLLAEGEALYIANAGMVLLWPFLDRYFHMLNLQRDGAFIGYAEQSRAALLLHYLVYGHIDADETELLLNKILCGVAPSAPLDDGGGALSEQERDASAQLHAALIAHWARLGNTDAAGLQQTFLRRGGRLVRNDKHWTLTVDKIGFDVLMTTLPWALGTIRLSWMSGTLTVVWV